MSYSLWNAGNCGCYSCCGGTPVALPRGTLTLTAKVYVGGTPYTGSGPVYFLGTVAKSGQTDWYGCESGLDGYSCLWGNTTTPFALSGLAGSSVVCQILSRDDQADSIVFSEYAVIVTGGGATTAYYFQDGSYDGEFFACCGGLPYNCAALGLASSSASPFNLALNHTSGGATSLFTFTS